MGRINDQEPRKQGGRLPRTVVTAEQEVDTVKTPPSRGNFITNAPSNLGALFRGEVSLGDVAREIPGTALRGSIKTADVVTPALSNFVRTTGGIFGEGLAYASSKDVREQYKAGNLDILPTITKTTQGGLLKDTVAAGLEATIIRSVPAAMKGKLATRAGIGGLEGIGFAISEGMAKDQSADEILKNAILYGVSGSALNIVLPWLGPLLRKELGRAPRGLKNALKQEAEQVVQPSAAGETARPALTPEERHRQYAESQGYEPYTPDSELPVIQAGPGGSSRSDLPTIRYDTQGTSSPKPPPGTRYVPEPTPRPPAPSGQPTQATGGQVGTAATRTGKQTVAVQGEQIPIGGPTKGPSRLEARLVQQTEDPAYQAGVNNYSRYANEADAPEVTGSANPEQIRRAAIAVETMSDAEINAVVSGAAELPAGILRTAFIKAATEKALLEGNSSLVNRLARAVGQLARRFGQEVQFTKNFDPLDPTYNLADILAVRIKAAERKLGRGETVASYTQKSVEKAKKETLQSQIKIQEAESLIDSILC